MDILTFYRTEDGGRETGDGGRRTEDGRRRTEDVNRRRRTEYLVLST